MKRSRVLEEAHVEAELPYEQTRLAKRAIVARRRLTGVLLLGALAALVEAFAARSVGWALGSAALAATAWGVRAGRLGGLVAAGLAALPAALLPMRLAFMGPHPAATWIALAVSAALGLAALPDLVTLARDAELQHAYGRWARRSD